MLFGRLKKGRHHVQNRFCFRHPRDRKRHVAQTHNTDTPELARIQSEYSDVLALQGTAKAELLAIARILRAKPEMAIDRRKAAGEYCFKSSESSMVQ